ncbi:hypothetical protein [Flavobacterium columnare]|nr:hypothetical protein [Flavobacterium columnare]AUX17172.1 hypothetical protein AQ623_01740 [Flavobacterium columnare]
MQPIYNAINSQNTQLAKAKIYATGELQVFKFAGNTNNGALEIGDFVVGIVGNQFIRGIYIGGDIVSLASFNVYDSIEF